MLMIRFGQCATKRSGEDLHVTGKDDAIDSVALELGELRLFLLHLVFRRDGDMKIGKAELLGHGLEIEVIADDQRGSGT